MACMIVLIMTLRICLVTPPSAFLLDERVFVSLGILKVGAVLEAAGHAVEHLDLSGVANYEDVARLHAASTPPDYYAITATSPQMPAAMRINRAIRETANADASANVRAKTILGGPHATLVQAAAKSEMAQGRMGRAQRALSALRENFDVIVSGDGERAVLHAVAAVDSGDGVIDADDPKSALWLTSQDFTDSPWPARHLVDIETYRYSIDGERALSAIMQLGCPFMCQFCAGRNSPMLRRMRLRSTEDAIAEVEHLHDTYGVRGFMFYDDELNVNREMIPLMRGLAESAKARGVEWKLRGFLKAELFTEAQAEAMYAAGFRQVLIGFESGSERILTNIQKKATREDNTRAVRVAHAAGLKVKALMSLGHAGETAETVRDTRDWLLEVRPNDFDCTIITPYPGSPYYDDAREIKPGVYRYRSPKTGDHLWMSDVDFTAEAQYYKGHPGEYVSYVWTDALSRERLVELRDQLEGDVRTQLGIPFYPTGTHTRFESSMGQTKLPSHILRGAIAR